MLRSDLTVTSPKNSTSFAATGVLAQLSWSTVTNDPISLTVQVSAANAQAVGAIAGGHERRRPVRVNNFETLL